MITVLGIDPGIGNTGYALIEAQKDYRLKEIDLIKTKPDLSIEKRINIIASVLKLSIAKVDIVAIEKIFFHYRITSALSTAYIIGTVLSECVDKDKPVYMISPQQAKIALGLRGNAKKNEVIKVIKNMFTEKYNQHCADAIGIAIAGFLEYKKNKI